MRIYLDNCCYNRPYDDQAQFRIHLEAEAKLYVQELILNKKLELVTSFVLDYENSKNRDVIKMGNIERFMRSNERYYIGKERYDEIKRMSASIMSTGIKKMDAYHVACSILSNCDYLLTTDDRMLKYRGNDIKIVSPGEFIFRMEG